MADDGIDLPCPDSKFDDSKSAADDAYQPTGAMAFAIPTTIITGKLGVLAGPSEEVTAG